MLLASPTFSSDVGSVAGEGVCRRPPPVGGGLSRPRILRCLPGSSGTSIWRVGWLGIPAQLCCIWIVWQTGRRRYIVSVLACPCIPGQEQSRFRVGGRCLSEQLSSLVGRMAFLYFRSPICVPVTIPMAFPFVVADASGLLGTPCLGRIRRIGRLVPGKERSSLTLSGCWKLRKATNLSSSGRMPPSEMMCPAKCMLSPISNFFLEIVMLFSSHRLRTVATLSTSCFSFSAKIIVSSTIFMA